MKLCGGERLLQVIVGGAWFFTVLGLVSLFVGSTLMPGETGWNPPDAGQVCIVTALEKRDTQRDHSLTIVAMRYPNLTALQSDLVENAEEVRWTTKCPGPMDHCITTKNGGDNSLFQWTSTDCSHRPASPCDGIITYGTIFDCNPNDTEPHLKAQTRVNRHFWRKQGPADPYIAFGALVTIIFGSISLFFALVECCMQIGVSF